MCAGLKFFLNRGEAGCCWSSSFCFSRSSTLHLSMAKPIPRQRKHKARARDAQSVVAADANALEILPVSKADKEERRRLLKEELRANATKVSSKKSKRLDKYIVCVCRGTLHVGTLLTGRLTAGYQTQEGGELGTAQETRSAQGRYQLVPKFEEAWTWKGV